MRTSYGKLLVKHPIKTTLTVLLSVAAGFGETLAILLLVPALTGQSNGMVEMLLGFLFGGQPAELTILMVFFFLTATTGAICACFSEVLAIRIQAKVETDLRLQTMEMLLVTPWHRFASLKSGDIGKSLLLDSGYIAQSLQHLLNAYSNALIAIVLVIASFLLDPAVTGSVIVFAAAISPLYLWAGRKASKKIKVMSEAMSTSSSSVNEYIRNMKMIRGSNLGKKAKSEVYKHFRTKEASFQSSQLYSIGMKRAYEVLGAAFVMAFILFVVMFFDHPVAHWTIFLAIFYRIVPRLQKVENYLFQFRSRRPWLNDWNRTHAQNTEATSLTHSPISYTDSLEYKNVAIPIDLEMELSNISFKLPIGSSMAITGPSGIGKTVVLDSLLGIRKPSNGSILVDGSYHDSLANINWQNQIGYVPQSPTLFDGTILENIVWGSDRIDRELVTLVLRKAHLSVESHFLERSAGEAGVKLSGGQIQRVAIARALYRQPRVLILDEPTSALDEKAAARIIGVLKALRKEMTVVITTHNSQYAKQFDQILDLGKVHCGKQYDETG